MPNMCVLVIAPPQITEFTFGDEPANTGEMASVQCLVPKGDLPVNIYWNLNNKTINNGDLDINIVRLNARTSVLSIVSLEEVHRGMFTCIANNKAGFTETSAVLRVNGSRTLLMEYSFFISYP